MYQNHGVAEGTLAADPQKVAEGVVLLRLRIRDNRVNPVTKRREFHYPTFVVFGRESDKALQHLVKGQELGIEYKLETRRKEDKKTHELRHYTDLVAIRIQYGRKPEETPVAKAEDIVEEAVEDAEAATPADVASAAKAEKAPKASKAEASKTEASKAEGEGEGKKPKRATTKKVKPDTKPPFEDN